MIWVEPLMYIIDIILKNNPVPLSVQKKTVTDAEDLYRHVVTTLGSSTAPLIELTCEQQPGKKITVLSSEISAVQFLEKATTATASGRPPGFFSMAGE